FPPLRLLDGKTSMSRRMMIVAALLAVGCGTRKEPMTASEGAPPPEGNRLAIQPELEPYLKQARRENKPLMLVLSWGEEEEDARMETEIFSAPAVKEELTHWVVRRINGLFSKRLVEGALDAGRSTTAVLLTPEGQVLKRIERVVEATAFRKELE